MNINFKIPAGLTINTEAFGRKLLLVLFLSEVHSHKLRVNSFIRHSVANVINVSLPLLVTD